MDPITAIGLISGGLQITQVIGRTVAGLASLRGKYNNADLTIRSLIGELSIIKAAIAQLDDWAKYNSRDVPEHKEYNEGLTVALDGCRAVMEILSEEVANLTRSAANEDVSIGFRTRVRVVWNEDVMRAHHERLQAQVLALQLLLHACQCRSSSEQVELLRRAENRKIIQRVADDTVTLRTHSNYATSRADSFSCSNRQSSVGDTEFDFDNDVVTSLAYRRVLQHTRSRSDTQFPLNSDQSKVTDEGYASGVPKTTTPSVSISANHSPRASQGLLSIRPHDTIIPEQARSKSVSFKPDSLQAGQIVRRWQSDSIPSSRTSQSLGSKRDKFRSVFRRFSQANLTVTSPRSFANSPTVSSIIGRRGRESDFNTSIDLTSPHGISAPLIVKIAQSGSRFEVERLIESGHDIEARHISSRRNALLVAAHCGNAEIVDLLIHNSAKLNVADGTGSTALHLAASRGHCEVLDLLLVEDLDIEAKTSHGRTALWVAADQGQLEAAQLLMANHAKVNARADSQMTALHAAAKRGDEEIVELLLSHGADMEAKDGSMMTALHHACSEGHLNVIGLLLNQKANIEARGTDRRTPLICAAATGKFMVVQLLLKRKVSARCTDDAGMTALHWAAYNGHVEIVDLLSQKKGSLSMVNIAGRTALHLAVMKCQFAVVELLLRRNASLDSRCESGLTPLHYACMADSTQIARLLLLSGSDIEAQTYMYQRRPVHVAAACGSMALLDLLCDKGASLEARDAMGDRALCAASRHGHAAAVQKLLGRGSPLHLRFGNRRLEDSPLCLAAMGGHLPVVSLLLQHGASILRKDEMGWQPFRYAAYHGHPEVLRFLLTYSSPLATDGADLGLTAEKIGFSPHGNISEGRKREVQNVLNQVHRRSHATSESMSPRNVAISDWSTAPNVTYENPPQPPQLSPSQITTRLASMSVRELPSTLEQGLPSSRSTTPEGMRSDARKHSVASGADAPGTKEWTLPPVDKPATVSVRPDHGETASMSRLTDRLENFVANHPTASEGAQSSATPFGHTSQKPFHTTPVSRSTNEPILPQSNFAPAPASSVERQLGGVRFIPKPPVTHQYQFSLPVASLDASCEPHIMNLEGAGYMGTGPIPSTYTYPRGNKQVDRIHELESQEIHEMPSDSVYELPTSS